MSLRSWVKFWNARSISEFSVLPSTTRKFRWESGGSVTCCEESIVISTEVLRSRRMATSAGLNTYSDACEKETGDGAERGQS